MSGKLLINRWETIPTIHSYELVSAIHITNVNVILSLQQSPKNWLWRCLSFSGTTLSHSRKNFPSQIFYLLYSVLMFLCSQYVKIMKIKKISQVQSTHSLSIPCYEPGDEVLGELSYAQLVWKWKKWQVVCTWGTGFVTAVCVRRFPEELFWEMGLIQVPHSCQHLLSKRREQEFSSTSRGQIKLLWRSQSSNSNSE